MTSCLRPGCHTEQPGRAGNTGFYVRFVAARLGIALALVLGMTTQTRETETMTKTITTAAYTATLTSPDAASLESCGKALAFYLRARELYTAREANDARHVLSCMLFGTDSWVKWN